MAASSRQRERRGQALVEYALVLPFLLLLILAMVECGRLFLIWHQAAGAARHGARQACLWRPTTVQSLEHLVSVVQAHAVKAGAAGKFTLYVKVGSATTCVYDSRVGSWSPTPALPATTPGVEINVKVSLPFTRILPMSLIPSEVSDYEIRYSEGEPNRS